MLPKQKDFQILFHHNINCYRQIALKFCTEYSNHTFVLDFRNIYFDKEMVCKKMNFSLRTNLYGLSMLSYHRSLGKVWIHIASSPNKFCGIYNLRGLKLHSSSWSTISNTNFTRDLWPWTIYPRIYNQTKTHCRLAKCNEIPPCFEWPMQILPYVSCDAQSKLILFRL